MSKRSARPVRLTVAGGGPPNHSFVSKPERGERRIYVIEFCQVAEALGHDPSRLLRDFIDSEL